MIGTVVGHFAGIAASMIIGGWAATFIASQVRYIEQVTVCSVVPAGNISFF